MYSIAFKIPFQMTPVADLPPGLLLSLKDNYTALCCLHKCTYNTLFYEHYL